MELSSERCIMIDSYFKRELHLTGFTESSINDQLLVSTFKSIFGFLPTEKQDRKIYTSATEMPAGFEQDRASKIFLNYRKIFADI